MKKRNTSLGYETISTGREVDNPLHEDTKNDVISPLTDNSTDSESAVDLGGGVYQRKGNPGSAYLLSLRRAQERDKSGKFSTDRRQRQEAKEDSILSKLKMGWKTFAAMFIFLIGGLV